MKPEVVEALAALEHEQWAHWTKYADLSEKEKESDREWARKVLEIIAARKTRADWAMPTRPAGAPADARPFAHLVGASDGWSLFWATPEQAEDGEHWCPDDALSDPSEIPWPFDNDAVADAADMRAAGFEVTD